MSYAVRPLGMRSRHPSAEYPAVSYQHAVSVAETHAKAALILREGELVGTWSPKTGEQRGLP